MLNNFSALELYLRIIEMIQTLKGVSVSDLIIAAVVFVLLKVRFNFELKLSFGANTKEEDNDKKETT